MFTENRDFYPTPKNLIDKMLCDLDFSVIKSILEPSAGKGDIVEALKKKEEIRSYGRIKYQFDIDCIEADQNLQHILKGKPHGRRPSPTRPPPGRAPSAPKPPPGKRPSPTRLPPGRRPSPPKPPPGRAPSTPRPPREKTPSPRWSATSSPAGPTPATARPRPSSFPSPPKR